MSDGENSREDIYSKAVRAGKRTYFFDVKATRGNDLYLTITESKRRYTDDGKFHYEKHKLFLYKEDFDKFSEGLQDAVGKIDDLRATGNYAEVEYRDQEEQTPQLNNEEVVTDITFDDLED
ncbi:MAG: DUF3276 family protein [Flavobacteriales bacterium]